MWNNNECGCNCNKKEEKKEYVCCCKCFEKKQEEHKCCNCNKKEEKKCEEIELKFYIRPEIKKQEEKC